MHIRKLLDKDNYRTSRCACAPRVNKAIRSNYYLQGQGYICLVHPLWCVGMTQRAG